MSVVGNLSRHSNLAELAVPREFPSFQSVATRQAEAKANLGFSDQSLTAGSTLEIKEQAAAGTLNATGTLTAALMLGGIVTSTTAAAVTATLDTGALLDDALLALYPSLAVGDSFDFYIVNTGAANALTVATAAGWTDGGNAFVAVGADTSAHFRARRTAADTYTLYKIA